jgi:hypothetical protein
VADNTAWWRHELTGGAAAALDNIPTAQIANKDIALVFLANYHMVFEFDSTATDIEDAMNHPLKIRPDDFSSAGVWIEKPAYVEEGFTDVFVIEEGSTLLQAQAVIDILPKYIPYGQTVTVQFASSGSTTYTFINDDLEFNGFYVLGDLKVQGNTSESGATTLHTTQDVFVDFSNTTGFGFVFNKCIGNISIYNLKIGIDCGTSYKGAIKFQYCPGFHQLYYSYLLGNTASYGYGLDAQYGSSVYALRTYVSNVWGGVYANNNSHVFASNIDDTGTQPTWGLAAYRNSVIGYDTGAPTGASGDTKNDSSSVVRGS